MKRLKQLSEKLEPLGYSDREIIQIYFEQYSIFEAVKMLTTLLQDSIEELERFKDVQLTWQTMPYAYYYELYPKEIAPKLDALTRKDICGLPLSASDIEWARENIPKCCLHDAIWQPLLVKLHKEGIYFKNETKEDESIDNAGIYDCMIGRNSR